MLSIEWNRSASGAIVASMLNISYLATSAILAFASLASGNSRGAKLWLALSVAILLLDGLRTAQASVWVAMYVDGQLRGTAWYAHRRPVQVACIAACAVALWVFLIRMRSSPARQTQSRFRRSGLSADLPTTFAISGFCALLFLAAVRCSSFHWTDALLSMPLGPLMLSHVLQAILLFLITTGVCFDLVTRGQEPAT